MKWLSNRKLFSFIALLVLIIVLINRHFGNTSIINNVINKTKRIELYKYVSSHFSNPQNDKRVILVINEGICENNLFLVYKLISEFNSNYINLIINSPYVRYIKPINKIYTTSKAKGVQLYIDWEDNFSKIFPFEGLPLILLYDDNKITGGFYLQGYDYDKAITSLSVFVTNN
ncbi:MAG: hypothetical protein EPN88_08490 [Bacteroidetes bacterium]|nr:MAG: hypothetical protein EPN88_08490 [Bacteroidota bacterium]